MEYSNMDCGLPMLFDYGSLPVISYDENGNLSPVYYLRQPLLSG